MQNEISNNPEWQEIANKSFPQAWKGFIEKVESFDELNDKEVDDLTKFMTESPRNIQDPVWTRWGTVSLSGMDMLLLSTSCCSSLAILLLLDCQNYSNLPR